MDFRALILLVLLLSACSTVQREPQDGGPSTPVDVSHIPNAKPKPVVRTRAGNAKVYSVLGKTYRTMEDSRGYSERGVASWYGTKFHGQRTANGEIYDMYAMTAAHKTLPIPSYVRVTHVNNGRSVIVRINDRGPFHGNRIIDLSYAAARKLGVDATGTALVDVIDVTPVAGESLVAERGLDAEVTTVPDKPASIEDSPALYLQLGAFQQLNSALSLRSRLLSILAEPPINVIEGVDKLHRVTLGPVKDEQKIAAWRRVLQANGLGVGYIVRR